MTHIRPLLGNIMTCRTITVAGTDYDLHVLNAGYCFHGSCFILEWTGKATTLPELITKFHNFAKRRGTCQKSA